MIGVVIKLYVNHVFTMRLIKGRCYSMIKYGTNSRVRVRDRDKQWTDIEQYIVIVYSR